MSHKQNKPAGIRQLAEVLGISIGTVDRALHGRPGISAATRDRVLKLAEELNYTPNWSARNLKLNRHLRIGVFLPRQIASFFDPLRDGIREAASGWTGSGIDVVFHSYPRLGEGELETLRSADWEQFDGVILAPGRSSEINSLPKRSVDRSAPMVFVATDSAPQKRISSVAVDAVSSGGIAAELLGHKITHAAPVVVFTGDLRIQDHAEKLRGFEASLATLAPHLTLVQAIESHDRQKQAHAAALGIFRKYPNLGGLYINTANSLPVLDAAKELGLLGKLQIITTDLFPELIPLIESGAVLATLYQRPITQGRIAYETLARYLTDGTLPPPITRLSAHIILRSNLSLFSGLVPPQDPMFS